MSKLPILPAAVLSIPTASRGRPVHFTLVFRRGNLPKASRLMNAVSLQSPFKHLALLLPTSRFYLLSLGGWQSVSLYFSAGALEGTICLQPPGGLSSRSWVTSACGHLCCPFPGQLAHVLDTSSQECQIWAGCLFKVDRPGSKSCLCHIPYDLGELFNFPQLQFLFPSDGNKIAPPS